MTGFQRILFACVAVVAALVVGGLVIGGLPPPSPKALGCDAASDRVEAPVAELAIGSPVSFGEAWADATLPETGPGFFHDIASFGDRAVAVGGLDGEAPTALTAVSDDGRTWSIASDSGPDFSRSEAVNAAATADGFVVSGSISTDDHGGSAGAIWWSATGERWQRLPSQPVAYIGALGWGSRGLLATASAVDGGSVLGSSADGQSWRWTPWPTRGGLSDVAPIRDGWIAVGSIGVGGDNHVPVVWRSRDGAEWSCSVLDTPGTEPFGAAVSVYPGRVTTLVSGQVAPHCSGFASCAASGALWVGTKEGSWRRLDSEASPFISALTVGGDGSFVALTDKGVSRSDDGTTWHEISDQVPSAGVPTVIAVMPWGLVGIGELYRGSEIGPFITFLPAE
jgi:hypothetical protein